MSSINIKFGTKIHQLDLKEINVQHMLIAINSLKDEVEKKTGMPFKEAEMISMLIGDPSEKPDITEANMDDLIKAIISKMDQNDQL